MQFKALTSAEEGVYPIDHMPPGRYLLSVVAEFQINNTSLTEPAAIDLSFLGETIQSAVATPDSSVNERKLLFAKDVRVSDSTPQLIIGLQADSGVVGTTSVWLMVERLGP